MYTYLYSQPRLPNEDQQKYTTKKNDRTLILMIYMSKTNKDEETTIRKI